MAHTIYYFAMFEVFSAGYYVGRLSIEPSDGAHAVMESAQHKEANAQVDASGAGVEPLYLPLVMKMDEFHVPVFAADDVPSDTLGLPESTLEATRVETPPTLREVLVANATRAALLVEWATPYFIHEPDLA